MFSSTEIWFFFFSAGQDLLGTLSQAVPLAALRQPLWAKRPGFDPGHILVSLLVSGIFLLRAGIVIGLLAVKLHLDQVSSTFRLLWNFQTERTNVIGKRGSSTENYRKALQVSYYFYIFKFLQGMSISTKVIFLKEILLNIILSNGSKCCFTF